MRERSDALLVLLRRLGRLEGAPPALLLDVDGGRVEVRVLERLLDLLRHVLVVGPRLLGLLLVLVLGFGLALAVDLDLGVILARLGRLAVLAAAALGRCCRRKGEGTGGSAGATSRGRSERRGRTRRGSSLLRAAVHGPVDAP